MGLQHNYTKTGVCCGVCEKSISGPSYNCIRCEFFIHQDCLEPVEKVQHPFYPHDHVLTPTGKFRCNACYGKTHNRLSVFFMDVISATLSWMFNALHESPQLIIKVTGTKLHSSRKCMMTLSVKFANFAIMIPPPIYAA